MVEMGFERLMWAWNYLECWKGGGLVIFSFPISEKVCKQKLMGIELRTR
jgi:hypothetical protein